MSQSLRHEYLQRLEELLPPKEAVRVCEDVGALIDDRMEEELARHPELDAVAAERAALEALGPPEKLADELVSSPLTISLATRRTFVRVLAAVFACHLLLSVALTFAGATWDSIPGILAPLPLEPFAAVFLGVVTIFFIDTGALLLLFVAVGRTAPERLRPLVPLPGPITRKGAVEGLVLLGLIALILNVFLDVVFSVRHGEVMRPFLAPDLKDVVPYANVVIGLFALRHLAALVDSRRILIAVAADALGCLTGSALLVVAATRGKLVAMPPGAELGPEAAQVLDNLIERVFLVVLLIAALLLVMRFVRQALRLARLLRR